MEAYRNALTFDPPNYLSDLLTSKGKSVLVYEIGAVVIMFKPESVIAISQIGINVYSIY